MGQEMQQMYQMLQNVQQSMEAKELERKEFEAQIKAYQAETQRISAVQAGMTAEQIQDIVMGTLHAAIATGDINGARLEMMEPEHQPGAAPEMEEEMGPPQMNGVDPQTGQMAI